jgi:hypothetical protein
MVSEVYYFSCDCFSLEMVSSSSFKGLQKVPVSRGEPQGEGGVVMPIEQHLVHLSNLQKRPAICKNDMQK